MLFKPFAKTTRSADETGSMTAPPTSASRQRPIGVIDIGSNSVRLVVYEGALRAPTPVFNEKELCGLGRKVASKGCLAADAVECALRALSRFRAIADVLDVAALRVIATAAVRDSKNGADFIRQAEERCRVPVEVLSGEMEARISAQGVMMGVPDADGIAADLGGGSVELVEIKNGEVLNAVTLPLGGLRLMDVAGRNLDEAARIMDEEIAKVPWITNGAKRTLYAVGGTWRAFAKLHMLGSDHPLNVMHEYALPAAEAQSFAQRLYGAKRMTLLPGSEQISKTRREIVPYGALLMEKLLVAMKPKAVQFCVFGVREGILFSMLPKEVQAEDPLISYCERLADLYARDPQHARELCTWTDALFDLPELSESAEEKRLRHAACLISDIGWRGHPDYRDEQSLDAVAHSALSGIDHPGRIFLALSIYFRHAGRGGFEGERLSARLRKAASKRALKRARIIGAAVRAEHMLSVGTSGIIGRTRLAYEDDRLVWIIPSEHARLIGARLEKRFATLAELVGRKPEIRIE